MENQEDIKRRRLEKLEEMMKVLDQLKIIIWGILEVGKIPEDDDADNFWTDMELTMSATCGILLNYNELAHLKNNEKYIDHMTSEGRENLKNLAEKINLEDYPQLHLNYLIVSNAVSLIERYYNFILENFEESEISEIYEKRVSSNLRLKQVIKSIEYLENLK
ncbi:hypothetical protein HNP86_001338 [Methanococcus maripaludis]|uniref:Uncharacterized protein n=1 Tax=Methanococcus maripaludis TaxID=39152 RepID=A0A7J9NV74_METMI|nr:hypothetical protein [Methanococcus maripaludis]MBA2851207.1 hypothetical protein [Methanococcus maripaludis]